MKRNLKNMLASLALVGCIAISVFAIPVSASQDPDTVTTTETTTETSPEIQPLNDDPCSDGRC